MPKPWFAPKRYGYGAGLPLCWEGWALLLGYATAVLFLPMISLYVFGISSAPWISLAMLIVLTPPFVVVARRRTKGGWRWRNGRD